MPATIRMIAISIGRVGGERVPDRGNKEGKRRLEPGLEPNNL